MISGQATAAPVDSKPNNPELLKMAKEALDVVQKLMPLGAGNKKSSSSVAKAALESALQKLPRFISDEAYAASGVQAQTGNSKAMSMLALAYLCCRYPSQEGYGFKFLQLTEIDHCLIKIIDLKTQQAVVCDPWLNEAYLYTESSYANALAVVGKELDVDISKINIHHETASDCITALDRLRTFENFLDYHYRNNGNDDHHLFGNLADALKARAEKLSTLTNHTEFDTIFNNLLNTKVQYASSFLGYFPQMITLNEYIQTSIANYPLKAHAILLALEQYKQALVSGRFVTEDPRYFSNAEPKEVLNCFSLNQKNDSTGAVIIRNSVIAKLLLDLQDTAKKIASCQPKGSASVQTTPDMKVVM